MVDIICFDLQIKPETIGKPFPEPHNHPPFIWPHKVGSTLGYGMVLVVCWSLVGCCLVVGCWSDAALLPVFIYTFSVHQTLLHSVVRHYTSCCIHAFLLHGLLQYSPSTRPTDNTKPIDNTRPIDNARPIDKRLDNWL